MYTKLHPVFWRVVILLLVLAGGLQAQRGDEDFRFRPDHERQSLKGKSPYLVFLDQEGIPVYTGWAVEDLYAAKLKPWKRQGPGVQGAYVYLDGTGGVVDAFCMEIAAKGQTKPERHLFEEQILILSGEGETHIWQKNPAKKVVIPWKKGTVFSPPLNTWHQHFNKGAAPSRLVAVTDMPIKLDLFRNTNFIFNNSFDFVDRYAGQANYFDPENSKDYNSTSSEHSLSVVNLVRNAWTWRLFLAGQGVGDIDRHFLMSDNTMGGHVEQFPVGTYERAHRHGPGSTIILLNGTGYSLMWPPALGINPWKDGKSEKVVRVDWKMGTILVPPTQWFHQHFNSGKEPARFIKLGGIPGNDIYRLSTRQLSGGDNYMILFREEDSYVRSQFETQLARHGARIEMPPMRELIEYERNGGEKVLEIPKARRP